MQRGDLRAPAGDERLALVRSAKVDDLLAEAIATLYDGVTEVPQLIKAMRWNDLYQLLEDTTDKAETVATVLSNIALKNA